MSETRDLPGPHCGALIAVRRSRFFPSRRYPIHRPTCQGLALAPRKGVLVGLAAPSREADPERVA